jgi:hypothetical protein
MFIEAKVYAFASVSCLISVFILLFRLICSNNLFIYTPMIILLSVINDKTHNVNFKLKITSLELIFVDKYDNCIIRPPY